MITLPIKKKWFDMLLTGEKKEEYREIKPYYTSRFSNLYDMPVWAFAEAFVGCSSPSRQIMFKNGYRSDSPAFIADCNVTIGSGKECWGAIPDVDYYVLTIEKIVWKSSDGLGGLVK